MRFALVAALALVPAILAAQEENDSVGVTVEVSGMILTNAFHNSDEFNNSDVPTVVLAAAPAGVPEHALGATVRQSMLRVTGSMPGVLGGALFGELETDFFGGQQPSGGGRTHPLLRIRRAFVELQWSRFAILVGQEAPPVAEVNPSTLASMGFPGFASAGNLWLWLPQVRLTAMLNNPQSRFRFGVEAAALAPNSGEPQDLFTTEPDLAERSGRPFLEGRLLARWVQGDRPGDFSVGAHLGWLATNGDSLLESRALVAALRLPISNFLEIRGEIFTGQALQGLGGGGIGQSLGPTGAPVDTHAGWGQVILRPCAEIELGGGIGIDNPDNGDVDQVTGRRKNQVLAFNMIWRPDPLVFGIEYRRIQTTYPAGIGEREAGHLNLAAGLRF